MNTKVIQLYNTSQVFLQLFFIRVFPLEAEQNLIV
jgi:hypothetical protein